MKTTQYAVWDNSDGEDSAYWALYDTLEDAVASHGDGIEVYQAKLTRLGNFKRTVKLVKVAKPKAARKKAVPAPIVSDA